MHTRVTARLLCCLLLAGLACKAGSSGEGGGANLSGGRVCELLSDADIKDIQGEAVSERQGSERATGQLIASQCFYRLPTFNKSISLEVIRPAPGGAAGAVGEFWEQRFRRGADEGEEEREKRGEAGNENERARPGGREKEEKEGSRPEPVEGVGDEAFWAGDQINASLYVRKGDIIVRLSVGGPESRPDKIKKTKVLAGQVLRHLGSMS